MPDVSIAVGLLQRHLAGEREKFRTVQAEASEHARKWREADGRARALDEGIERLESELLVLTNLEGA